MNTAYINDPGILIDSVDVLIDAKGYVPEPQRVGAGGGTANGNGSGASGRKDRKAKRQAIPPKPVPDDGKPPTWYEPTPEEREVLEQEARKKREGRERVKALAVEMEMERVEEEELLMMGAFD